MFLGRFLSGEHIHFLFFLCTSFFLPTNVFSKFSKFSCGTKELHNSSHHRIAPKWGDDVRAAIWTDGFYNILCRIMCCFALFGGKNRIRKVEIVNGVGTRDSGHTPTHTHTVPKTSAQCRTNLITTFCSLCVDEIETSLSDSMALRQKSYHTIPFCGSWAASIRCRQEKMKTEGKNEKSIVFSKMRMPRVIKFGIDEFSISMEPLAHVRCLWLPSYSEFSIRFSSFHSADATNKVQQHYPNVENVILESSRPLP